MISTREQLIRDYMLSKGWTPPTSVALEKQREELGAPLDQPHIQRLKPGPHLPAMPNPFGGQGVGMPLNQDVWASRLPTKDRGLVRTPGELHNAALELAPVADQSMQQVAFELESQYNVALANNAPVNTLPVEQFLRSTFVEGKVLQRIAPQLLFLDLATQFTTDSIDIVWFRHNFSADTDTNLREPAPIGEDGLFPRTTVGDPVKKMGSVGMWGLGIDFTRRALRHTNTAVDDIQRKIDWSAWKLAQKINVIYGNVLTGYWSTTQTGNDAVVTEAADTVWSDPLANPFKDIRDLALKMKTESGHYFQPTELILEPTNYRELRDYADTVDHDWATNPINGEVITTFDGIQIREAPPASGIAHGFGVMLARNTGTQFGLPLTVWEAIDPEFTRTGMLHTDRFRDPETKLVTVLMWKEFFVANRNPKAVGLLHSA